MGREYTEGGRKSKSQLNDEENNPCWKEHHMSLKCLSQNNYDNEACQLHFQNYRTCRDFWSEVKRQRRIKGISPALPPLEERTKIKGHYMATGKLNVGS